MNWFSEWFHKACTVEQHYLQRIINDRDATIAELRARLSKSERECEELRMAMMPFSSQAGVAYSRLKAGAQQPKPSTTASVSSAGTQDWQTYLADHMSAEEEAEKAAQKSKEKPTNGTQGN